MLHIIERYGIMPDRQPSLEPIQGALKDSGLFECMKPERTIVIAGTNGKGTVTATLSHLLRAAGQSVGMYTSPHLVSITERIQTNGKNITPNEMLGLFHKIQPLMEKWKLSHFEVLTLMMAEFFFRSGPRLDWYVIETGMGGTFDATNALLHKYCVITTLGMDHEKFLGPGLSNVARNKFGIVQPPGPHSPTGCDVILSPLPPEAEEPLAETTTRTQARFHSAPQWKYLSTPAQKPNTEPEFWLDSIWGKAKLSLAGPRAALNTNTALKTFEILGFKPQNFLEHLKSVHWDGRMSRSLVQNRAVYFSGDHNPQGIESLLELLKDYNWKRLHLVVGIGIEKDAENILARLKEIPRSQVHLTCTPFRGKTPAEYGNLTATATSFHTNPMTALDHCLKISDPDDMILVTGSLYLVGHLLFELQATGHA